jgi:hypothetical protein
MKVTIDGRDVQVNVEKAYQRLDGAIKKTKTTGTDRPVVRYMSGWVPEPKPSKKRSTNKVSPAKNPPKSKIVELTLPEDLNDMTLKDLKKLAAEIDLAGRSTMSKKDLVKAMS